MAANGSNQNQIMYYLLGQPSYTESHGGRLNAETNAALLSTDAITTPRHQIFTFLDDASLIAFLSQAGTINQAAQSIAEGGINTITTTGYVLRGQGKAKYVVAITEYTNGWDDLKRIFPADAGVLTMRVGQIGKVFLAADVAINGWDAWGQTVGEPLWYRLGYTAAETTLIVSSAAAAGTLGAQRGSQMCGFYCAVGVGLGSAILGGILADHTSDWVVELAR
jgi:hypothetical protein